MLSSGSSVLLDLAQGAKPCLGDSVEIYGTEEAGGAVLLAKGAVSAIREGTAQITVAEAKVDLRIRDAVYLDQRDR